MKAKIVSFLLTRLRKTLELLHQTSPLLVKVGAALLLPFVLLWKVFNPLLVQFYKFFIIIRKNAGQFFHAQHKVLALVTASNSVHLFIGILVLSVVWINVNAAQEVRAEEFLHGSVIDSILNPDTETVLNANPVKTAQKSYIESGAAVRATTKLDNSTETINIAEKVANANSGSTTAIAGAVQGSTGIDDAVSGTNKKITKYEVKGGDTIGSIAKDFGISQTTILSANGLDDASARKVKPGDSLYILPTNGVAHTVQAGDTADSLAQKYSANKDEILAYNKIIGSTLEANVEIIIPNGKKPEEAKPATPAAQPTTSTNRFARSGNAGIVTSTVSSTPAPSAAPTAGGGFIWPTTTRRLSRGFGYGHTGLDIDGNYGDPIYASKGGRVVIAGGGGSGYGIQVLIDHGGGVQTRYGHLQKLYVSAGQTVSTGQTIGQEGSTGNSTGSHLHFETIINGRTVNPFNYVR